MLFLCGFSKSVWQTVVKRVVVQGNRDRPAHSVGSHRTLMRHRVMRAVAIAILFVFLHPIQTVAGPVEVARYEASMISSGDNVPSVDFTVGPYAAICAGLHHGRDLASIGAELQLPAEDFRRRLMQLTTAGLLAGPPSSPHPTFMVVDRAEGAWLKGLVPDLIDETAATIAANAPTLEHEFSNLAGLATVDPRSVSLLLYSDILLDDGQIQNVEAGFIQAQRPARAGKSYYFALLEKDPAETTDAFGIYGNAIRSAGGVTLGLYGNRRSSFPDDALDSKTLEAYVRFARTRTALSPSERSALERADFIRGDIARTPVMTAADGSHLQAIATKFAPALLRSLVIHRPALRRAYASSRYVHEVTFPEFSIWWYHFFYTAVTNRLIERGVIVPPALGVVPFVYAAPSE